MYENSWNLMNSDNLYELARDKFPYMDYDAQQATDK